MSKFFSKTVKKNTLWAVVCAVLLAAAIVICALLGFNKDSLLKDRNTLTLSVNQYAYSTQKELIISEAESKFGGEKADYVISGEMSGDVCEIVFVFGKDAKLDAVKTALVSHFDGLTEDVASNDSKLKGAEINVSAATETAVGVVAKHFALRAGLAGVIFAGLAFAYVAARYQKLSEGVLAGGSVALSMLLAAALVVLTRVPVTPSIAAVIATAGFAAAISVILTLNKLRGSEGKAVEENIAWKETLGFVGAVVIATWIVGAISGTTGIWFALATLLGLVAATFVGLIVMPSAYVPVKAYADEKAAEKGYVGAKKTSTKEKKTYAKKEKVAKEAAIEEPAEATTEEVVEEATAEEEVAENVNETSEEVAEEATAEEPAEVVAEEVAEEPAAEVAEENGEEVEAVEEATEENA